MWKTFKSRLEFTILSLLFSSIFCLNLLAYGPPFTYQSNKVHNHCFLPGNNSVYSDPWYIKMADVYGGSDRLVDQYRPGIMVDNEEFYIFF